MVKSSGLGDEPRRVLAELSKINLVDVVLPTSSGVEIRKRCITRPTEHQEILLQHLGLTIDAYLYRNLQADYFPLHSPDAYPCIRPHFMLE